MRADKKDRRTEQEPLRDRIRRRAKERRTGNRNINVPEGMEFYRAKKGRESARLDIIPYRVTAKGLWYAEPGGLWYEKSYKMHYQVGGGDSQCVCPTTVGKKCPICEFAANLKRQPKTPENEEIIKQLRPKNRQLFNVIDLAEPDKGIQIHENAFFNFGKELEKELAETEGQNPEFGDFADLKNGFTLKVRWDEEDAGGGNKRTYVKAGRIDFVERKRPYTKDILEETVDLDNVLIVLPYEEIERMFNGVEDEDEEPPATHSKRHEEEEEEEERPKPSRASKSKYAEDEEEEETPLQSTKEMDEEKEERRGRKHKVAEIDRCPENAEFGKDWDSLNECEDCKIWGECREEYKKLRPRKGGR